MKKFSFYLIPLILIIIALYPKFPLIGVTGTFVAIRLEDFFVAMAFAIFGLYLFSNRFEILKKDIPRSIVLYWFIGSVATFSGIFLTTTAAPNLGFLHFFRRIEYMSLFFTGYTFLVNRMQLKFLLRLLLLISVTISIYGIGQILSGFPVISTNNSEFSKGLALQLGPGARINSTFAGHYDLAAFSVFPMLLILSLLPITKSKVPLLVIFGLVYWVLLMSASRVTFVSFFTSATLLLLVIKKQKWLIPLGILAVLGILISPQLRGRYWEFIRNHISYSPVSSVSAQSPATPSSKAVDTIPDALTPSLVSEDRSFNIRLNVEWPRAIRSVVKNPALGTGFSSIGLAVDNEYLRIMAETGILGLLAFGLIFIRFIKTSLPFILKYRPLPESAFIVTTNCYLFSLFLGGLFIDVFAASKIALFVWTIMGLAEKTKAFSYD